MKKRSRCACGLSKKMPWCDGSHQNEDWACEHVSQPKIKRAFVGAPDLQNLMKRLAWRFDGEVLNSADEISGEQLIIIEDGSTLARLKNDLSNLQFDRVFFIGIDFPTALLAQSFNFTAHFEINGSLTDIFVTLESTIERWFNGIYASPDSQYRCETLSQVFISHAVADETFLLPVVDSIRQVTQLDVFLCFDSINQGEKWRRQIEAAIDTCQLFIFIVSKASVESTYCAYETGCAISKNKQICLISIDGSLPPAYISHLHCIDLQREIKAKPWLDLNAALTTKILEFTQKVCEPV